MLNLLPILTPIPAFVQEEKTTHPILDNNYQFYA